MTIPNEEQYYHDHAAMLGHVSLAWNDCHFMVFNIFHTLSGMAWMQAQAVFFALKADQAQRDITAALLQSALGTPSGAAILERGTQLLGQIGGLAGERNAATHTMWATLMPDRKVAPTPMIIPPKTLKEDFSAQFEHLRVRLRKLFIDLVKYHGELAVHLAQQSKAP
jgi:hypothetical protein